MLNIKPCGTLAGYRRHHKLGEPYCNACRKANTEHINKWNALNRERSRELNKKSAYRNKERVSTYAKKWYQENKERIKEQQRNYYYNNKDKAYARSAKRRAIKHNAKNDIYTVGYVVAIYGTLCYICKDEIDLKAPRATKYKGWERGLHIDHVIPLSKGGSNTMDNVRPVHGLCNISKGQIVQEVLNA